MKIGYRTASFGGREWSSVFKYLGELGYTGVELCLEDEGLRPEQLTEKRIEEIKGYLAEAGLEACSLSWHIDIVRDDESYKTLQRSLDLPEKFGTDILIISSGVLDRDKKEELFLKLEERLASLLNLAEEKGVALALEPEPDLIVEDIRDMQRLLEKFASRPLRVNLDIGHAYCTDEDILASVKLLGENIVHTHFEDIKGKVHRHLVPGQGDMDLEAIDKALKEIGYEGYYTIDLFNISDPDKAAAESISALKNLLS